MLNTDQCIEIAEKVWGWKELPNGDYAETWNQKHFYGTEPAVKTYSIREIVNEQILSWQGFGRTVEAMQERQLYFQMPGGWVSFRSEDDIKRYSGMINLKPYYLASGKIITATHLAALEALK